jgi:hypothetical protein
MLNYVSIISQVQNVTGTLFAFVGYAATPQLITTQNSYPKFPAVFISPEGGSAEKSSIQSSGNIMQLHTENFCAVVLWEDDGDLLGQNAMDNVGPFQQALRSSIVNWRPFPLTRTPFGVEEGENGLFDFKNGAFTAWIFKYSIKYKIQTSDCYYPPQASASLIPAMYTSLTPTIVS